MINFKRLCGFGVKETLELSRPTTNATTNVMPNYLKMKVTIITILLTLIFRVCEVKGDNLSANDSISLIKGKWILTGYSLDSSKSIGFNFNSCDRSYLLFDFLKFNRKNYTFKNEFPKEDVFIYGEYGVFRICNDTLNLISRMKPHPQVSRIVKLNKSELVIETLIYEEALGGFKIIGLYKRK